MGDSLNPQVEHVRTLIEAMPVAENLGLEFVHISEGRTEIRVPVKASWSYGPRHLQAAAVFAAADFAAVSAADWPATEDGCKTMETRQIRFLLAIAEAERWKNPGSQQQTNVGVKGWLGPCVTDTDDGGAQ